MVYDFEKQRLNAEVSALNLRPRLGRRRLWKQRKKGTKPDEEEEERKAPRFVEDEYKMEAETRTATRNGLIQGSSLYKVVGPAVH